MCVMFVSSLTTLTNFPRKVNENLFIRKKHLGQNFHAKERSVILNVMGVTPSFLFPVNQYKESSMWVVVPPIGCNLRR